MKLLFCAVCIFCASAFAVDRDAFTFTHTQLQVTLDPSIHGFAAKGTVTLRNDSGASLRVVVLQVSSSLDWRSITVAGKPVQFLTHGYASDIDHTGALSEAIVTLPHDVLPHGMVTIEVSYGGTISLDSSRLEALGTPKDLAAANDWDQISSGFTGVRGVGYVAWYPVALEAVTLENGNEYSAALQRWRQRVLQPILDVQFSVPAEAELISNGANHSVSSSQPSLQKTLRFTQESAASPFFVIANYQKLTQSNVTVYFFSGQEDLAKLFAQAAATTQPFLRKPPAHPLEIVALPQPDQKPYDGETFLLTPLQKVSRDSLQVLLAHFQQHCNFSSPRPWISEGLANFAQAWASEQQSARPAALDFMAQQLPALVEDERNNLALPTAAHLPAANAATSLAGGSDEIEFHTKAMYVWWMLRDILGEAVLQRALAAYHPEDDHEPAYLPHLLEQEAKAAHVDTNLPLEQFFEDWVYQDRGLPDFRIASTYVGPTRDAASGTNFLLTVTVENLGGAGAEVPVIAHAGAIERVERRLAVPAHSKASIRIPLVHQPDTVTVNDGSVPESDMSNNSATVSAAQQP